MSKYFALAAATLAAALACSLAIPSSGSAAAAQRAGSVEVRANLSLTSFAITPGELHLMAGRPVLLRVSNDSRLAHDLTAPGFFASASLDDPSRTAVVHGKVSLAPHENVILRLVPGAGRYPVKCSHQLHKMFGMSGTIIVDR